MSRKNLIGQTFNRLTVIRLSNKKKGTTYLWECQCSCGKYPVYATTYALTNGKKKSCGCLHTEQRRKLGLSKSKHRPGEQIENYKLLYDSGKRVDGRVVWVCECLFCGREKEISSASMRQGKRGMPLCDCQQTRSRGEAKIIQILNSNNIWYQREYSFSDLTSNGKYLRFDFRLQDNTLIEYDGIQHFGVKNRGFGEPLEVIQKRDFQKNKYCLDNNITLIRIPYTRYEKLSLKDLLPDTSNFIVKEV